MTNENFERWLQTLETTPLPQAKNTLVRDLRGSNEGSDLLGYCCLGIACKISPDGSRFLDGNEDLLPVSVADWLGLGEYWETPEYSIITWEDVRDNFDSYSFDIELDVDIEQRGGGSLSITTAWLNDQGFTFAQIADMLRYFGICRLIY